MREVFPGVFMLERTWGCNVYVLRGDGVSLVDAGFPLDGRRIVKALDRSPPSTIIATHYHIDHIGPMARLKHRYGAVVAAHSLDAEVMEGAAPYEVYKLDPLRAAYYRLLSPLYRYEHVGVDLRLEEGNVIPAFGGLVVVHLPGHTAGSVALYQPDRRLLFSGDTIRNERGVLEGPPPQFTPDVALALGKIREKILPLEFDALLPGHGRPLLRGASEAVAAMVEGMPGPR